MAYNGLQHALATLDGQSATQTLVTDPWSTLGTGGTVGQPGSERFTSNDGTYRVQIVDAGSLIDLNTASQAQLTNLPLTQEQVDCLLDWRETTQTETRTDGAKDDFYDALPKPYLTKLGRLDTLDELLLIDNFTFSDVYDIPTTSTSATLSSGSSDTQPTIASLCCVDSYSTPSTGGRKVNVSNANFTAAQLTAVGISAAIAAEIYNGPKPYTTYAALLRLPGLTPAQAATIINNVTVSSATTVEGKININTATQPVLNSIPGMTSDVSASIVSQQQAGFTTLGSLLTTSGITVQSAAALIDSFSVSSTFFLVRVVGTVGSTNIALEATVSIASGKPVILKVEEQPFNDMPTRWNWYDVQTDTTILDPSQVTPAG